MIAVRYTYKAALARIIDAHHALPIATIWGDGSTSSSDRQFFRSAKRGDAAGDVNACCGHDPDLGFYTHISDQHGPYSAPVMSATSHEAPHVLDGLIPPGPATAAIPSSGSPRPAPSSAWHSGTISETGSGSAPPNPFRHCSNSSAAAASPPESSGCPGFCPCHA